MKTKRYTLKLASKDIIDSMGEPVYFKHICENGRVVEWVRGIATAATFGSRAAVEAFRAKWPHVGGRIVRALS